MAIGCSFTINQLTFNIHVIKLELKQHRLRDLRNSLSWQAWGSRGQTKSLAFQIGSGRSMSLWTYPRMSYLLFQSVPSRTPLWTLSTKYTHFSYTCCSAWQWQQRFLLSTLQYLKLSWIAILYFVPARAPSSARISSSWHQNIPYLK